jgi:hypothetical protein
MSHTHVQRVEEIRTSYEANRYLELGWVLLQVFPGTGFNAQDKWPFYIMAWTTQDKPDYPAN